MGVTHQAHDGDLAFDLLHEPLFLEPFLFYDFDGHALVCAEVSAVVHLGEVALSQQFSNLVLVEEDVPGADGARGMGSPVHLEAGVW